MRFNKQELATLATQPSNKFEKEGIIFVTERQDGFFRRSEVSLERWCRLRGNLLFYFKSSDQFSEPQGVIVLEKCEPVIRNEKREHDGFVFFIEFQDNLKQRLSTNTESERAEWIQAIRQASYEEMRKKLQSLREQIENRRDTKQDIDVDMMRLQIGKEIDISEVPICEAVISCDNLLCDGHGRPPNPTVIVQISEQNRLSWIRYGRTEVIERCSNPQYRCTAVFRSGDGLHKNSLVRFTVYDVREKVSQTAVPLGSAEITLGTIQETARLRIPLQSNSGNAGFITLTTYLPEQERKYPRSPARQIEPPQRYGHRRSQSLPPKLGIKLNIPPPYKLSSVFVNPTVRTYRLHSGLGGDISVFEVMMESRLCFTIPQQLLSIWILREKELLQEISGMGELGGEWRNVQMELLDKHLKLLKEYSQAKQNLQQCAMNKFFKQSSCKNDESLEFAPVNLHLQRMWAYNDTLKRDGFLDVITVGAFTKHSGKTKTGGLIKLLQLMKDSPSKVDQIGVKVRTANDAVQSIKQLRKEIVEIMSQLLSLAKLKNPKGMLPLCNEMITKTRSLLNIWEPSLVEEAFAFIEKHRIIDDSTDSKTNSMKLSPFRNITQQLGALELKSPDLEDFASPTGPMPNLWSHHTRRNTSPCVDIPRIPRNENNNGIVKETQNFKIYQDNGDQPNIRTAKDLFEDIKLDNVPSAECDNLSYSLPPLNSGNIDDGLMFSETHFDVSGEVLSSLPTQTIHSAAACPKRDIKNDVRTEIRSNATDDRCNSMDLGGVLVTENQLNESKNEILLNSNEFDENGRLRNCSIAVGQNGTFLDTKAMSSSPSANYYRPTEEPEPLDLTQLNIEASVMCLVSKVKFLCGRCGSPAVRLRQPKPNTRRGFTNIQNTINNQPYASNPNVNDNETKSENTNLSTNVNVNNNAISNTKETNKELNLALNHVVDGVTRKVSKAKGNKFTDGLDLSLTTDWASELRPSMRKLRTAMDGLLKTARLMHSVQRLQQDMKKTSTILNIIYRRDVCLSQSLTAIVSALMAKLWGSAITENYIQILCTLGPLAYFEGLLSLYGSETDMWGDMCVAIEDLSAITFTLIRSNIQRNTKYFPVPRVTGSRQSITVLLPVPDNIYSMLPNKESSSFKITPVFFNIGINEYATLSETLGYTREQHRSNFDNYDRLKQYFIRYKKIMLNSKGTPSKSETLTEQLHNVTDLLNAMEESLRKNASKNTKILHLAEDICRGLHGLRLTSCKSAKDRTAMSITVEQCRILQKEFHLPANNVQVVLDTMRSEGTRSENTMKNIGLRKYAFNLPQVLSLPQVYRPPTGSYGKAQS
ncbi:inositol polyphosphate-4-phosphatase type I A isoform X2 [Contarinia nasturtii]|uniref:inositol polyphosphate-4-phosphatase type I A isoform X2 n=1 Tax=Contarinia nasturtii TaxID=265458 RepID=UPI0012D3DFC2|nr:inositol polyphosphate-4-phosphatase type I A isoform X2 [Contarinia nasturtii]